MRVWSLLVVSFVIACKTSSLQPVMIDSSDSIHFTLDTIVDNDCADHLSKLIGYDYLLVPNEYYDEVEDPRSKNFREYRVMLSVNINLNDINLLI